MPFGRRLLLGMEEIRRARDADAPAIASLITHLGYPTTAEQMRRRLRRISTDQNYVSLVAAERDYVLGFLGLTFGLYYERDGFYGRIIALSVAPEARMRGVGTKLLTAAEEIASSRGAIDCIVNSGLQRAPAHRFYEARGFSWQAKAFYKPLRSFLSAPPRPLARRDLHGASNCGSCDERG